MKQRIADALRGRLADVAERGKVIGQALRVRADMAATRRRLRGVYAELGEEVYRRLRDGQLEGDHQLLTAKERIDGLRAEVRQLEADLQQIVGSLHHRAEATAGSPTAPEPAGAASP